MNTHGPSITARAVPGKIEIKGQKPGFSAVTVQMRIQGTSDWLDIGMKINHFPFPDITAPKTPGKPEVREYRALGYLGDGSGRPAERHRHRRLHRLTASDR